MIRIRIIVILFIAMAFGFLLEMVKVNINYILEFSEHIPGYNQLTPLQRESGLNALSIDAPYDYYHNHRKIGQLNALTQQELNKLKWIVTLVGIEWNRCGMLRLHCF